MKNKVNAETLRTLRFAEGGKMKFEKVVFWVAGIWGLVVITPLYFLFDLIGKQDPPAITHPGFYYGFAGCALAWQIAFICIGRDPVRLRVMMIPSVVEKFTFGVAVVELGMEGKEKRTDLGFAATDLTLGVLFVAAWVITASGETKLN